MGREANKEMLVRPSFIGEMPSVGRNHKMSVQWMTGELRTPRLGSIWGPGLTWGACSVLSHLQPVAKRRRTASAPI